MWSVTRSCAAMRGCLARPSSVSLLCKRGYAAEGVTASVNIHPLDKSWKSHIKTGSLNTVLMTLPSPALLAADESFEEDNSSTVFASMHLPSESVREYLQDVERDIVESMTYGRKQRSSDSFSNELLTEAKRQSLSVYCIDRHPRVTVARILGDEVSLKKTNQMYEASIKARYRAYSTDDCYDDGEHHYSTFWQVMHEERKQLFSYALCCAVEEGLSASAFLPEEWNKTISGAEEDWPSSVVTAANIPRGLVVSEDEAAALWNSNALGPEPSVNSVIKTAMIAAEMDDYNHWFKSFMEANGLDILCPNMSFLLQSLFDSAYEFYVDGLTKLSALNSHSVEAFLENSVKGLSESDASRRRTKLMDTVAHRKEIRRTVASSTPAIIASNFDELFQVEYPETFLDQLHKRKLSSFEQLIVRQ